MAETDEKVCPFCGETIKAAAVKCRYCREFLAAPGTAAAPEEVLPSAGGRVGDESAQVLYEGPLSRVALIRPAAAALVWVLVGMAAAVGGALVLERLGVARPAARLWPAVLGLAVILLALIQFGYMWLLHQSRRFRITVDRIQFEQGVFGRRVDNLDMWRVNDVRYERGVVETMLGVGRVIVLSSDASDPTIVIGPVRHSRALFERLQVAQRQADRRQGVVRVER